MRNTTSSSMAVWRFGRKSLEVGDVQMLEIACRRYSAEIM